MSAENPGFKPPEAQDLYVSRKDSPEGADNDPQKVLKVKKVGSEYLLNTDPKNPSSYEGQERFKMASPPIESEIPSVSGGAPDEVEKPSASSAKADDLEDDLEFIEEDRVRGRGNRNRDSGDASKSSAADQESVRPVAETPTSNEDLKRGAEQMQQSMNEAFDRLAIGDNPKAEELLRFTSSNDVAAIRSYLQDNQDTITPEEKFFLESTVHVRDAYARLPKEPVRTANEAPETTAPPDFAEAPAADQIPPKTVQNEANANPEKDYAQTPLDAPRDMDEKKGFVDNIRDRFDDFRTRVQARTVDSWNVAREDKAFSKHNAKSVELQKERDVVTAQRKAVEGELKKLQDETQQMFSVLGDRAAKENDRVFKDEQKLKSKIEALKGKEDTLNGDLKIRNEIKEQYQLKRDGIAQGVIDKLEKRLEPHADKLRHVEAQYAELDAGIKSFTAEVKKQEDRYAELKKLKETTAFKSTRNNVKIAMEELDKVIRMNRRDLNDRTQKAAELKGRIAEAREPVNKFLNVKNKFTSVMKRTGNKTDAFERGSGDAGASSEGFEPFGSDALRATAERSEQAKQAKPEEFVTKWNKAFRGIEHIDTKPFAAFLKSRKVSAAEPMSVDRFTAIAKAYLEAMRKEGVTKASQKEIAQMADRFEKNIKVS